MSIVLSLVFAAAVATPVATDCDALLAEAAEIARMNRSDATGGIEAARAGLERARAAGCTLAEAEMYAALGDNLEVTGARPEAVEAYEAARGLLAPLGDSAELAASYRREGIAHAGSGDYTAAVERTLESLRISEALGDANEAAMAAGNLATLYSRLGDFDRARAYFERAHTGFIATGNRVSAAGTGINLGSLLMRRADGIAGDDPDQARALRTDALAHNLGALEEFETLGHPRGISMAASNAGLGYDFLGQPERALTLHRRSLEIREQVGDADGLVAANIHLAHTLTDLRRYDEAEAHLERASELVADRSLMLQLGVVEKWVRLEEARGRPAEALARMREANDIRERMVAEDHRNRVAEVQARYDTVEQQRRIESLQNAQSLAEATVSRQRLQLLVGGAALALLASLLAVGYGWSRSRRRYAADMAQAARTDELTGLSNRRDARERIAYEIRRSRRTGRPFALALIDLDGFKAVNDALGHDAGDELLVSVTRRIHAALRRQDTLARWGGDELLLLLPETGEQGAAVLAQKIVDSLSGTNTTLTVGVTQYWPGSTVDDVVRAADDAMYRGKRAGRNRVMTSRD